MITVLAIGSNKDDSFRKIEAEYLKRLSAFCRIQVLEVKDEPNPHPGREKEEEQVKEKEGERALARIGASDFCVLLDLRGKQMDSEAFAEKLAGWNETRGNLVFVIAGSLGPSPALVQRADFRWKLSDLTFTHLMTRMLVLEQIYRGFMIQSGRTYHK
ncbi:MAG: 23S rRNA (pseudouridine(1915)-N(3))-methyltransferase RlmH [Lachnospiraceae bacterium]|nr:23S rRNA (pseudouridine(1915)-N(3))-methyltransferase RlmH [Lachnospiraceae bacterium]